MTLPPGDFQAPLPPQPGPETGRCAALLGPTASGKTALAVALRKRGLPIEVVGCDALQLYRRLEAATAKPDPAERLAVPHHLIDLVDPRDRAHAGLYVALADAAVADITARGGWPLLVGGTGLYHRSFVRGLAAIPEVPIAVRERLTARWDAQGPAAMHAELGRADPHYAANTPAANRQRVLRALEVYEATGRSLTDWHRDHAQRADRIRCWTAVLEPDRDWHMQRIAQRAQAMAAPLLVEVAQLLGEGIGPQAPAMQALGYRDAARIVGGQAPREGFAERLAIAHRRYAKRQATWFRSTPAALRVALPDPGAADRLARGLQAFFTAADPPQP